MSNILQTLTQEHGQLSELFGKLNATADSDTDARKDLLKQIEKVLIPHAKWEEHHFYPAFADRASHDQKLLQAEAMTEHRAVELAVLPDIHAADAGSRQFAGTAKAFSDLIKHHAKEEESEMFAAARQLFDANELSDLDRQYAQWKESSAASAIETYAKAKTAATAAVRSPDSPG